MQTVCQSGVASVSQRQRPEGHVSVALAVAVWLHPNRPVIATVVAFTAAALVLDVLEINYQLGADRIGLAALAAVIAALRTVASGVGESALTLLQAPQPPPIETVLTALLNDLGATAGDLVLVRDHDACPWRCQNSGCSRPASHRHAQPAGDHQRWSSYPPSAMKAV